AALFIVVAGMVGGAAVLQASEPPTQDVSVPAAGQTSSLSWTGTIPVATHASSDCSTLPAQDPTIDHHAITIHVPAAEYTGLKTTFTFSIAWAPSNPTGLEDVNDEILTIVSHNGDEADQAQTREIGSSDGSATTETFVATNLPP